MDTLKFTQFQEMAKRLEVKYDGQGPDSRTSHLVFGIVTEAGELADCHKKTFTGKPLDRVNQREEVGDILFYLVLYCDHFNFTLDDAMDATMKKLSKRYDGGKFDPQKCNGRDVNIEHKVMSGDIPDSLELFNMRVHLHELEQAKETERTASGKAAIQRKIDEIWERIESAEIQPAREGTNSKSNK